MPSSSAPPSKKSRVTFALLAVLLVSAALFLLRPPANRHDTPRSPQKTELSATTNTPAAPSAPPASATPPANATTESLETLAATDPRRALDLALAEKDDAHRNVLLQSVLRGWARTAPDAASDWAWANQPIIEQGMAFSAIFNGTQHAPDTAIRLAQRLAAEHPSEASSFGRYLIHSLAQAGHFTHAADYAASAPTDSCTDLLTAAYHPWGGQQPEKALQAASALEDPLRQNAAFQATIDGWSQTNPQTLAEAAYKFPPGPDRSLALVAGLRRWIEKDPATAETWIKAHQLTAEESARALEE